jgi:hypothetical protein
MKRIPFVIFLILFSASAKADFPLSVYQKLSKNPDVRQNLLDYVVGTGRGIFWANIVAKSRQLQPLFCMPEKLELSEQLIEDLLNKEIKQPAQGTNYQSDTPIELILTNSFIHRFPC